MAWYCQIVFINHTTRPEIVQPQDKIGGGFDGKDVYVR